MIDFVGTSLLLRIALLIAMATMHFHMAKTQINFGENILSAFRGS